MIYPSSATVLFAQTGHHKLRVYWLFPNLFLLCSGKVSQALEQFTCFESIWLEKWLLKYSVYVCMYVCMYVYVYVCTYLYIVTCISDFRRGFGSVSRFTGCSPDGDTTNYNTFSLTVTTTLPNCEQL
jgi:hypothetical protein